jgi:5-hydroxyisourate hydrolase-like protein (transthyretin family)
MVELTLAPGSETETVLEFPGDVVIRGMVIRNGAPVPGAMVSFAPSAHAADMGVFARTDPRGAYEVVGLETGPHTVRVFGEGVSFSTDYAVAGSAEFDIDVTGGTVVGHVVRADGGTPVAGVAIAFFRMDGQQNTPAETATTSAQGAFSQGSLRDGRYRLVTSKAGFGQEVRDVEVARGGTATVTIELQEAEGVSLTEVDARDGRALEAIVVVRDEGRRIVANRHSGVGDDGVLNIPLANGSYILSTSATGYGTVTLRVRAPSRGLRVALTPGGTLRIESQRDLRGRLRLVQPDGEEYVRCWCNGIADIELGGRVTVVENVTPGAYTVELPEGVSAAKPVVIREGQVSTITIE